MTGGGRGTFIGSRPGDGLIGMAGVFGAARGVLSVDYVEDQRTAVGRSDRQFCYCAKSENLKHFE